MATLLKTCVATNNLVGLPDTAVQEARERVRAALRNSGCEFPMRRITVNLAPADLKKGGPAYDLPIAMADLLSSRQITPPSERAVYLGELSLDESLRHTTGILATVAVAHEQGFTSVYVPTADTAEAALVEGVQVFPTPNLATLISHLRGESAISPVACDGVSPRQPARAPDAMDLAQVKGQGTPQQVRDDLFRYQELGLSLVAWDFGPHLDSELAQGMETFAREVAPSLTDRE